MTAFGRDDRSAGTELGVRRSDRRNDADRPPPVPRGHPPSTTLGSDARCATSGMCASERHPRTGPPHRVAQRTPTAPVHHVDVRQLDAWLCMIHPGQQVGDTDFRCRTEPQPGRGYELSRRDSWCSAGVRTDPAARVLCRSRGKTSAMGDPTGHEGPAGRVQRSPPRDRSPQHHGPCAPGATPHHGRSRLQLRRSLAGPSWIRGDHPFQHGLAVPAGRLVTRLLSVVDHGWTSGRSGDCRLHSPRRSWWPTLMPG